MARLRLLIILLAIWLVVLFNAERYDNLGINLSTALYIAAACSTTLILLFPDLGNIRVEYSFIIASIGYLALRYTGFSVNESVELPVIITEMVILFATIWLGRKVSSKLSNIEEIFDNALFDAKSLRVLPEIEGEEQVNHELFRARRYERPVSIVMLKIPTVDQLQKQTSSSFSYQLMLQHRYIKSRIAQIAESLLYEGDPIIWHGDDLVICMPETNRQEAIRVARRISKMVNAILNFALPIGIADFPDHGLIYRDLVISAENDLHLYDDTNDTTSVKHLPKRANVSSTSVAENNQHNSRANFELIQDKVKGTFNQLVNYYGSAFDDLKLVPARVYQTNVSVIEHPFEDPDFWVNQIRYQSAISRMIYHKIKRAMDIGLILLAAPALIVISSLVALAIRLEDGGPIFYSQYRMGLGGRKFKMYKFRSMVQDADKKLKEMGVTVNDRNETVNEFGEKLNNDPRITRIGRFIRKTSIDELPQLWNVLRGHMSLIGPRPTSFGIDKYTLYHTQRLSVKPGITGLWQVYDRGDTNFDKRLIWDIKYIEKMSLVMDIQILFRTVLSMIKKQGA